MRSLLVDVFSIHVFLWIIVEVVDHCSLSLRSQIHPQKNLQLPNFSHWIWKKIFIHFLAKVKVLSLNFISLWYMQIEHCNVSFWNIFAIYHVHCHTLNYISHYAHKLCTENVKLCFTKSFVALRLVLVVASMNNNQNFIYYVGKYFVWCTTRIKFVQCCSLM